jgi:hypothetical protein
LASALVDVAEVRAAELVRPGERPVVLVTSLGLLSPPTGPQTTIAVVPERTDLAQAVTELADRPWLNHLVPDTLLDDRPLLDRLATLIDISAGARFRSRRFFGAEFRGRKAPVRDSDDRARRIESTVRVAEESGASPAVLSAVNDLAEELITNALYDAPAARLGALERTVRRVLPIEDACEFTYGTDSKRLYLRARDPFGSLTRTRLLDVLVRCARGQAAIDGTNGGAGLGMWKVFTMSSFVLIRVRPGILTEVVVGLDLHRPHRRADARSIHLLFEKPPGVGAP